MRTLKEIAEDIKATADNGVVACDEMIEAIKKHKAIDAKLKALQAEFAVACCKK
jgi:hypothetical protein